MSPRHAVECRRRSARDLCALGKLSPEWTGEVFRVGANRDAGCGHHLDQGVEAVIATIDLEPAELQGNGSRDLLPKVDRALNGRSVVAGSQAW